MAGFELRIVEAGDERLPCVVRGPGGARRLLIVPPLFEEMNRSRRLMALAGEALAQRGVETVLSDLPGTGDHDEPAAAMDWMRWRGAVAALATAVGARATLALRGGALLDDAAGERPRYRLAPVAGAALLRDLLRARAAVDTETGGAMTVAGLEAALADGQTVEAAGYALAPALASALRGAAPAPPRPGDRTAALGEADGADVALPGPPPWRAAEAVAIDQLAQRLAADVDAWLR